MLTPAQWVDVFRANLRPEHHTFRLPRRARRPRATADEIIDALRAGVSTISHFENCCGELVAARVGRDALESPEFWGIDSSLLHLARIAGLRCVSYWGPTDPATRLRDTWDVEETTHYRKIACSPCVHTSEEPPCRGDNRCIQGLFDAMASARSGWTPIEYPRTTARYRASVMKRAAVGGLAQHRLRLRRASLCLLRRSRVRSAAPELGRLGIGLQRDDCGTQLSEVRVPEAAADAVPARRRRS